MTNNNLPEWAISAFEQAGVSTDGWVYDELYDSLECRPEPLLLEITRDGRLQLWGDGSDRIIADTCGIYQSIQLADRLKRAIQQEPDPRVAELEELIRRFYVASSAMLTGISIANDRQGANIKGEVVDNFNKVVNEAKTALAKARGDKS